MRIKTVQSVMSAIMALHLSLAAAAPPAIGTIVSRGAFRLDDATVSNNATLFEGAMVETRLASSALDLSSGPHISLAPDSRGRIFGDRLVLERGSGQMERSVGFRMEARGLIIRPETGQASARVTLSGSRRVLVSALAGSFRVLSSSGLLVANLDPGAALEFEPQAPGEAWKLNGCLRSSAGHFLITDETTNVTVEVAGAGLPGESGNRVEITGALDPAATPVSGATQVIRISQVRRLGRGCPANRGAAPAGAGGAAGKAGGTGSGLSTTSVVAIIGGVAAAATLGGLAAASDLPGQGGGATPAESR